MPVSLKDAVKAGVPMMLINKTAEKELIGFIEFELIKLSTMVNIDSRLNLQRHQIPLIATELYESFKYESMEDISLCLRRGAMGRYSPEGIFRLDGAVISGWMSKYLEEKYQVVEDTTKEMKETPEQKTNTTKNLLDLYKAIVGDAKPGDDSNASENSYQKWKLDNGRNASAGASMLEEHKKKIERARRSFYLNDHPDASEEEIEAYLLKFNSI